ncbi:DUF4291 domain-containing protein [Actinokineospora auranticolor]|uniref:DUF4291 domain-containing protein n=1 Tax=Actinokineospora auranticolor TaxID=155976 RepID=UPI001FE6F5EC|nr:DUF4291 domain-containing protein [Actinokineospora auranticolor]
MNKRPEREVRAFHDSERIRVYQAYPAPIADAALAAGTFVPPFKRERMTWIKPSFLWMAYRCGYARKVDQERVLAVDISPVGFHWALGHAALSHFRAGFHADHDEWQAGVERSPVRIQWDPERNLAHGPLAHRSIQIGLSAEAVRRYVDEWIVGLTDVTATMRAVGEHAAAGRVAEATALLPEERPYPLPEDLASRVNASR